MVVNKASYFLGENVALCGVGPLDSHDFALCHLTYRSWFELLEVAMVETVLGGSSHLASIVSNHHL